MSVTGFVRQIQETPGRINCWVCVCVCVCVCARVCVCVLLYPLACQHCLMMQVQRGTSRTGESSQESNTNRTQVWTVGQTCEHKTNSSAAKNTVCLCHLTQTCWAVALSMWSAWTWRYWFFWCNFSLNYVLFCFFRKLFKPGALRLVSVGRPNLNQSKHLLYF